MTRPTLSASRLDWLLFLALGGMWGSSFLFIKVGVEAGLQPFTLVALRLLFGTLLLVGVFLARHERLPRDARTVGHLLVLAVVSVALPFSLITWAEQRVDSALAAAIDAAVPIFVIPIAAVALHDEPIDARRVAGVLVGFLGVALLVGLDPTAAVSSDLTGGLAVVAATISYACGAVYARRHLRETRPTTLATLQVGLALPMAAALALVFERPLGAAIHPDASFAVAWLGLLGSGLAYLAFFRLLADWGATRASLVAYLLPVVGVALGAFVLHEQVDGRFLLGTALVVGGIAVVNRRPAAVHAGPTPLPAPTVDCPEPA